MDRALYFIFGIILLSLISSSCIVAIQVHGQGTSRISHAHYDEQLILYFTQNFTSLAYNVTAVAQSDTDGYGPAYLLNGLSNLGYWYQVGLSYNWPNASGRYNQGFNFVYETFAPGNSIGSLGNSIFPSGGGSGLLKFSGPVNAGDSVLLNLYFYRGNVIMYAKDWNTGATAHIEYSDEGATYFIGLRSWHDNPNNHQVFTGLMTEWRHANPYSGNELMVTYSNYLPLESAWMYIGEHDTLNLNWTGSWSSHTSSPVQL